MPKTHPKEVHYDRSKIQPIDFMESSFTEEEYVGYLKGQIIKYISRFRYKNMPLADLDKAIVYLNWLKEFCEQLPALFFEESNRKK